LPLSEPTAAAPATFPEGAANMTGSTAAQFVIPIVAFILLFSWLGLVFWGDSHPVHGNSEPGSYRTAMLPEGSSVPRPRVEAEGTPREPAPQGQAGRAGR
jgi:hypothetical protein